LDSRLRARIVSCPVFPKNMLEQLAPGEDLDGKRGECRRDGAGVERDTDVVIEHLDTICVKNTVEN